jgi:hypothetical protein
MNAVNVAAPAYRMVSVIVLAVLKTAPVNVAAQQ